MQYILESISKPVAHQTHDIQIVILSSEVKMYRPTNEIYIYS